MDDTYKTDVIVFSVYICLPLCDDDDLILVQVSMVVPDPHFKLQSMTFNVAYFSRVRFYLSQGCKSSTAL